MRTECTQGPSQSILGHDYIPESDGLDAPADALGVCQDGGVMNTR